MYKTQFKINLAIVAYICCHECYCKNMQLANIRLLFNLTFGFKVHRCKMHYVKNCLSAMTYWNNFTYTSLLAVFKCDRTVTLTLTYVTNISLILKPILNLSISQNVQKIFVLKSGISSLTTQIVLETLCLKKLFC